MQTERRKHPRVKPDPQFRVQCYSADFVENPLHRTNLAQRCLDLSAKGACVVTTGRLRVGASVILSIDVPDTPTRFRGKSVIRWSQSVEKKGQEAHVAGMEILEVLECQGERVGFLGSGTLNLLPDNSRQKHRRVLVNEAEVNCSAAGLLGSLGLTGNVAKKLVDVSEGGCKLILEKKIEVGHCVKLQLSFKHPNLKVTTEGIVRRCDRDTLMLTPRYEAGIEFQNMSNEDAAHLRLVLKALSE